MKLSFLLIFPLFACQLLLGQTIIYVDKDAFEGGDGTSWALAYQNLQDALDQTVSGRGDQVWIADGVYYPDDGTNVTHGDRFATFLLKDNVSIYGSFNGSETELSERDLSSSSTILSGEIYAEEIYWSIHVTSIENNGDISFNDLSIIKGNANGSGTGENIAAAVYGQGSVNISNCIFSDNSGGVAHEGIWTVAGSTFSDNSGGIGIGGIWTVADSTFSNNTAYQGGIGNAGIWTVTGSTFSDNSAGEGGIAWNGSWTTNGCIFSGNSASSGGVGYRISQWTSINTKFYNNSSEGWGGVLFNGPPTSTNVIFVSCIFSGNSAGRYGGVTSTTNVIATNCVFSGNYALEGGGVTTGGGNWVVTNCTFVANFAPTAGVAYFGTWKLHNNIFYNNGSDVFQNTTLYSVESTTPVPNPVNAYNVIEGGSAAFVGGTNNIPEAYILDSDPLFVNVADPDGPDDTWGTEDDGLRLQSSSPAIGLGDASFLPVDTYDLDGDDDTAESLPVDIAGYKRIQDTTLDLGAYEYGNVIGLSSAFTTTAGAATGGSVSPSGAIVNTEATEITLTATADNGYIFGYWSGDVPEELEQENPLTLTVEEDGSITAVFLQDSLDSDGDGLSQYQEVIVYGTDPADADSDDDGFDDGFEVETGYSPLSISSTPDAISGIETAVKYWFNAASGVSYRIEYSTDLENWFILEDNILGAGGEIVRYYDTVGTQKRFYRAKRDD